MWGALLDREGIVLNRSPRPLLRIDTVQPRDCAAVQPLRQP
jgi:hypothetical protein